MEAVIVFLQKYTSVPMSSADACLVRMSETMSDPLILTTDSDFHVYRRHSRQAIPIAFPSALSAPPYSNSSHEAVAPFPITDSNWHHLRGGRTI
jgi:hypothetical protein